MMVTRSAKLFPYLLVLACSFATSGSGASLERDYGSPENAISSRTAGALLLDLVNAERQQAGAAALELSRPASRLAREHAEDMAQHGYVGHYDLQGRKCELRYNLLGETDHVAENIAFREVHARVRLTPQLVRSIFADWMASPRHRANMLHPGHTHMGYGFAAQSDRGVTKVYAVQEFVNDWGDFESLPARVAAGKVIKLQGWLNPAARCAYIAVASELPPGPRSSLAVGEADLHYRQPVPEKYFEPGKHFQVASDRGFAVEIPLNLSTEPRDVYITGWIVADGIDKPFRAMTQVVKTDRSE